MPPSWKYADVIPLPKQKPMTDINKHLRPISLTSCISKVGEEFVSNYIAPAILKIIDPNQYGAIPKSSTTQALISIIHQWSKAVDSSGATVRVILYDYRKAFDLIDHNILIKKINDLPIPRKVVCWVVDFLTNRYQRVKLANVYSDWESAPSGVPQGTKLGPWLFFLMINDLRLDGNTSTIPQHQRLFIKAQIVKSNLAPLKFRSGPYKTDSRSILASVKS